MAKNDIAGIQTAKEVAMKLAHISMMKARGLPSDHIEVVNMADELVQLVTKFRQLMAEDAEQYTNLPDNVVTFPRPTAH